MKKSRILILVVISLFIIPIIVNGQAKSLDFDENNAVLISSTTKYIKTIDEYENYERDSYGNIIGGRAIRSESYELTPEEWNNSDFENTEYVTRAHTIVVANYRIMTTSLNYSNGKYRYKNQISWTTMPSVRAIDIIGIGRYNNVSVSGTPTFVMDYVTATGAHLTGYVHFNQNFTHGSSATFPLPLENLQSLSITYYYDVQKASSGTITSQGAFGDYSHGTDSTLTISQAAYNHEVYQSFGNVLNDTIYSKFDAVAVAEVYWNGTW